MLFNALFGTGHEATAYFAAFRLPDVLFNLIAGGALVSAFLPIFVSYQRARRTRGLAQMSEVPSKRRRLARAELHVAGQPVSRSASKP